MLFFQQTGLEITVNHNSIFSIYYYLLLKPVLLTYVLIQNKFSDYFSLKKSTIFLSSLFKPKLAPYVQLLYWDTSPSDLKKDSILLTVQKNSHGLL